MVFLFSKSTASPTNLQTPFHAPTGRSFLINCCNEQSVEGHSEVNDWESVLGDFCSFFAKTTKDGFAVDSIVTSTRAMDHIKELNERKKEREKGGKRNKSESVIDFFAQKQTTNKTNNN